MKKVKVIVIIINILFLFAEPLFARDDFQHWSQYLFKTIDTKYIDLFTWVDMRLKDDATTLTNAEVSEKAKFDFWKNLTLGLNYTYLNSKVSSRLAGRDEFKFTHRIEPEMTPHWKVGDWLNLEIRNRVEFRWIEDNGANNTRYRQKWTFDFPLKNILPVKSVYTGNEFFYDQKKHEYNEDWLTPLGVSFKVSDKTSFNVYYMIQLKKGIDDWSSSSVLGTVLSMAF